MTTAQDTIFVNEEGDAGHEQLPIPSISIANLLQQRDAILTLIHEAVEKLTQAYTIAEAAQLGIPDMWITREYRSYGIQMAGPHANTVDVLETAQACIDAGGWDRLIKDSGLRSLMSATKRKEMEEAIHAKKVPPLTRDAILETFKTLHESRAEMFEQGVIECFQRLSWHYKTNLPQKFGKRIVVSYLTSYGGGNGPQCNHLDDLLRVFHVCDGKPEADHRGSTYHLISEAMRATTLWPKQAANEYFSVRLYKNQSGHVTFTRPDLVTRLNLIIAKHYPAALAAPK